jgi:glutaredoxin 3
MQEITVYTTKICAYCDAAKRLLTQRGYSYKEVDLSHNHELRTRLSHENNGWRTVPMIFIGKEFVGGFTELAAIDKKGELEGKVNRA